MGRLLFSAGCNQGFHLFEHFQEIPTKGAADVKFEEFQSISTNRGSGLTFFTIEGEHYLAVAEKNDGNSSVYKWKQRRFVKYQNIPTDDAKACDSTVIANETFLVYANHFHPEKKYNYTESSVYKWSGGHFIKFQSIQTQGAYSAKFFRINGHVFLAFANRYTGSKYNTNSPIYKWDGVKFTLFQEIPTQGAMDIHPFEMNGEMFLAIANHATQKLEHSLLFTKICKPTELEEYTPLSTKAKDT